MCELVTELIGQGRAEGIQGAIAICKKLKVTFEVTAEQIKEQFQLDEKAAQRNMELYW